MKKILLIVLIGLFFAGCNGRQVSDSEFRANLKMMNDQLNVNADRQQRAYESQMNAIKQNQPTMTHCLPDYFGGVTCIRN